ncbi:hypothetical protein BsWGS_22316 [Bradybaena similaris]
MLVVSEFAGKLML